MDTHTHTHTHTHARTHTGIGHTNSESTHTFLTRKKTSHNFFLCSWRGSNSGHWCLRISNPTHALPVEPPRHPSLGITGCRTHAVNGYKEGLMAGHRVLSVLTAFILCALGTVPKANKKPIWIKSRLTVWQLMLSCCQNTVGYNLIWFDLTFRTGFLINVS